MSLPDPAHDALDVVTYEPVAVPTDYHGCRFRSRLEARWAVLFDQLGIGWLYEPERFTIGRGTYLPDFLLECGTWVEVKGHEGALHKPFLKRAALALPKMPAAGERGPRLLILGPVHMPYVDPSPCDVGWLGIEPEGRGGELLAGDWGFGNFGRNRRLWWLGERELHQHWLKPTLHPEEADTHRAYVAANGARFEYGESGAR